MLMTNPVAIQVQLSERDYRDLIFRAVVTSVVGNQSFIRRDGAVEQEGSYPQADGLALAIDDEVIVLKVGTGYFIVAKVARN